MYAVEVCKMYAGHERLAINCNAAASGQRRPSAGGTPQRERTARHSGAGLIRAGGFGGMAAGRPPPATSKSSKNLNYKKNDKPKLN